MSWLISFDIYADLSPSEFLEGLHNEGYVYREWESIYPVGDPGNFSMKLDRFNQNQGFYNCRPKYYHAFAARLLPLLPAKLSIFVNKLSNPISYWHIREEF